MKQQSWLCLIMQCPVNGASLVASLMTFPLSQADETQHTPVADAAPAHVYRSVSSGCRCVTAIPERHEDPLRHPADASQSCGGSCVRNMRCSSPATAASA